MRPSVGIESLSKSTTACEWSECPAASEAKVLSESDGIMSVLHASLTLERGPLPTSSKNILLLNIYCTFKKSTKLIYTAYVHMGMSICLELTVGGELVELKKALGNVRRRLLPALCLSGRFHDAGGGDRQVQRRRTRTLVLRLECGRLDGRDSGAQVRVRRRKRCCGSSVCFCVRTAGQ